MPEEQRHYPFFHPATRLYRFTLLLFVSLLTFGSYFAYDSIGALENTLINALGLKTGTIGSLYSAYSVAAIIIVFFGGLLTDRLGTRRASLLFSALVVVGAVIVALAHNTWMLFLGRFIFGAGSESLVVAQLAIQSKWFKGKELALSFGISLAISRLGTFLTLNTSAQINDHYNKLGKLGYKYALWMAAILCLASLVANFVYCLMDIYGDRKLERQDVACSDKIVFSDITSFKPSYWYVSLLCLTFYSAIFPFTALSTNLFADKWKIPDVQGLGFLPLLWNGLIKHFLHPDIWTSLLALSLIIIVAHFLLHHKKRQIHIENIIFIIMAFLLIFIILRPGLPAILKTAPGLTSIVILASMIFAPFAGRLVDRIGRRASLMILGCIILVPCHLLLGISRIYPAYPMAFLGIAFILVPAAMWPSIPLIVPKDKVGTAFGLTTMIQNIGLTLFPFLNGILRGLTHTYMASQIMFALLGVAGLFFAFRLIKSDRFMGNVLEKN